MSSNTLRELTIELTRECMNQCIHCSSLAVCEPTLPALSMDVLAPLIEDAARLHVHSLSLSGGEPFLHPHFPEILSSCKKHVFDHLFVYTSGVVRGPQGVPSPINDIDVLSLVREVGAKVVFNIQSIYHNVHDRIVGASGRLAILMESIQSALRAHISVECHIVPNKLNLESLAVTTKELLSIGVKRVSFLRLVPQGNARDNRGQLVLGSGEMRKLRQVFMSLMSSSHAEGSLRFGVPFSAYCGLVGSCQAGASKLIVRWDGAVFPCEAFKDCGRSEFCIGRIGQSNLSAMLHIAQTSESLRKLKVEAIGRDPCPAQSLY